MSPWTPVMLIFAFPYPFTGKGCSGWPCGVTVSYKLRLICWGYYISWTFTQIHKMSVRKKTKLFGNSFKQILESVLEICTMDGLNFPQCLAQNSFTYLFNVWVTKLINRKWIFNIYWLYGIKYLFYVLEHYSGSCRDFQIL